MEYIEVLKRCKLFKNVGEENIVEILDSVGVKQKSFGKGQIIVKRGAVIKNIGILLNGSIAVEGCTKYFKGDVFGIEAVLRKTGGSSEVKAMEDCEILLLNLKKLLKISANGYSFYYRIIENMLEELSEKNTKNEERLRIISNYKLRNKLIEFFKVQKHIHGNGCFGLNMSRTELAEYLCVDRCSLSRELTKLQKEGIIKADKQKIIFNDNVSCQKQ